MASIKWLRETLFSKCQFARDSRWTETANGGNSTMQPLLPPKKWDAVYLQQIWWIARMDPFTGKGIVQYFVSIVYPTDKLRTRRWDLRALPA